MSFLETGGRILVTDGDAVRLDTDQQLFHIVPPAIAGSRSMGKVSGSISAGVNRTTAINIGTCHPDCTHIIGAVKITSSGNWGPIFNRWMSYLGGTIVFSMTPSEDSSVLNPDIYYWLSYRFYIDAGNVYLEQRVCLPKLSAQNGGQTPVASWPTHVIAYRMKCGLWT